VSVGDVGLAIFVAILWGLAFVATRIGLDSFSPAQLAMLRFAIASLPIVALPRPAVRWPLLAATGLTLFAGQFILQFLGMAHGIPPGLASLVVHTQAFFTVLFAALVLRERPTRRHVGGMAIAFAGLALIAATAGADLRLPGLALTLGSAVSWGIGNIFLKRLGRLPQLDLMIWLSLVPPLPALALAIAGEGAAAVVAALAGAPWHAWAAVLYLGLVATAVAYTLWGRLLARYPVATVTPFALLVPFVGALASSIAFGERFGPLRLAGMTCVMLGLAVIVLPWPRRLTA
jgi:O-acetylserine/cysteine efflux transporter